jgi:4-hydroxy-3-methylbut-2-enyl diphosphate reductase
MQKMYNSIHWGKENNKIVYSLGNLIHNDRAIQKLNDLGVVVLEEKDIATAIPGIIVLRAHGVKDDLLRLLLKKGFIVVDATCPIVIQEQNFIKDADKKYHIVIIGKKNHPEAEFLYSVETSHTKTLVSDVDDIDDLENEKPLFVVMQSTFPLTKAEVIYEKLYKLKNDEREVVVANSPCASTKRRQIEIEALSKATDCIIVIGGENSSNTNSLKLHAEYFGKPVYRINSKEEIPPSLFGVKSIGIATGTSTPTFIIDEILETLRGEYRET